jgi:hypothetical protein
MSPWIIVLLAATVLIIGRRLATSRAENAQLVTHIAALKRQLAKRDR